MQVFYLLAAIQLSWIGFAVWWLIKRKDELPLIASLFLLYMFSFRFWTLLQGWTLPVDITNFGFEPFTIELGIEAQALAVLGQSIFLIAYCFLQKRSFIVGRSVAPLETVERLFPLVLKVAFFCVPVAVLTRLLVGIQTESGRSIAFEVSNYLWLFPLALVGVAILLAAVLRAGGLSGFFQKLFGACAFGAIAYLTFGASLRFQFLGWLIAATIILSAGKSLARKSLVLSMGVVAAIILFAIAGALRSVDNPDADLQEDALERFAFAEDANMLDGFVLLRQVYPSRLDFSYGGEHLEILMRPIPRAWWPGKPVGSYMNKLGLTDANTGFTIGISPSLFGSFYQEGGVVGLAVLSAVYGLGFGKLMRWSAQLLPLTGLIIRGSACAALIPLLRGGDLPGNYAWFGMSFWPIALVLFLRRKEMFPKFARASAGRTGPMPPAQTDFASHR
jgi:hypothetical protein